ncbi:unnamed protein product [Brachionus calyciflorus]|uniref:XPC n=1 Tax=Brachionus calyciflorus TaxID=104777 RepID=A0A813TTC1_9BILA|nr:unnamed protein product [Brachionus calyciflorus]
MRLRTRTSEKIVYLDEDSDLESDFQEAKSRKSLSKSSKSEEKVLNLSSNSKEIKKSQKDSRKSSEYFKEVEDKSSDDEEIKKKPKRSTKKNTNKQTSKKEPAKKEISKTKEKVKKEVVIEEKVEEPMQIDDVKTKLTQIENVESKIDLLLKFESNNKVKKTENDKSEMSDDSDDDIDNKKLKKEVDDDEEDDDEFEEVEMDHHVSLSEVKMDKDEIQVTIGDKKVKKSVDLQARMERMFKSMQKKFSVAMLKTHLLCWAAHGFYLNKLSLNPFIRALVISIDPSNYFQLVNFNKECLQTLLEKTNSLFHLNSKLSEKSEFLNTGTQKNTLKSLGHAISSQKCSNYLQYLLILIVLMRSLNLKCRLCVCLDVITVKEEKPAKKTSKKKESDSESELSESEEDEKPKKSAKKSTKKVKKEEVEEDSTETKPAPNKKIQKNNLILSDDSKLELNEKCSKLPSADYRNYWLEVYLEEEKYWCPVEPLNSKLDCASYLEKRFEKRVLYVLAYDNENRIKDVTKRYSSDWCIQTRLLRVSNLESSKTLWWEKTLLQHQPLDAYLDMEEEKQLKEYLLQKPLPQTVSEFKNHPLYVLPRHLLKFQTIYPKNATPISHFRKEPIYSTDNLVTLCSRQTWLKYARMVKPFEEASKIVKGRIKMSDYKAGCRQSPDLDLYGFWQTKLYEPPYCQNGIVPRNEFGNVELFQPCMLPKGSVHLKNMPNSNKVCRKLKIDCAAAVVGFDAHGGFSHAVYDGWVICEEHKDTVIDAYIEEEREANLRLMQKRKDRILNNWKRLCKSLLVRERLKEKYGDDLNHKPKKNLKKLIDQANFQSTNDKDDDFIEVDKVGAKLNNLNEADEKSNNKDEKIDYGEQSDKVVVVKFNRKTKPKTTNKTNKPKRKRGRKETSSEEDTAEETPESESEQETKSRKKKVTTTRPTRRTTRSTSKLETVKSEEAKIVSDDKENSKDSIKIISKKIDDDNGFKLSESDSDE